MAKSASPIRLQQELMQSASAAAALHHRSTAEQIEYWASLGRQVARFINPEDLLDVASGLARFHVEPVPSKPVPPDAVFAAVERARTTGALSAQVSQASIRYQASADHPGALERITADGKRTVGHFVNGAFSPLPHEPDGTTSRGR